MRNATSYTLRRAELDAFASLRSDPSLVWVEPWRAVWPGGGSLTIESADELRMRAPIPFQGTAQQQLLANASLPGNLRWARAPGAGTCACAEIRPSAVASVAIALAHLRAALAGDATPADRERLADDVLARAVRTSRPASDGAVERDGGFDVRPRLCATDVTVRVEPVCGGARCSAHVIELAPESAWFAAACDAALRANFALRHARLALAGDALCAEARIATADLSPRALELAACAVAAASSTASPVLALLAEHDGVARGYAAALLP